MVLVPLEASTEGRLCGIHEGKLPTRLWVCRLCSNVQGGVLWPWGMGWPFDKVWCKVSFMKELYSNTSQLWCSKWAIFCLIYWLVVGFIFIWWFCSFRKDWALNSLKIHFRFIFYPKYIVVYIVFSIWLIDLWSSITCEAAMCSLCRLGLYDLVPGRLNLAE